MTPPQAPASRPMTNGVTTSQPYPIATTTNSPIAADTDSIPSDEERNFDTQSLSASITDYPMHWGRRYHKYREGTYLYPNDESESERLDIQHAILNHYFDGRLYFARLDPLTVKQVLDIGTGTGLWPIELAECSKLPHASITGIDLSPIQPTTVPSNVCFEIQDCSDTDWCRPASSIDFIHSRFMAGSLSSYRQFIRTARTYLAPGSGWLELHEIHPTPISDDSSMPADWPLLTWESNAYYASRRRLEPARSIRVAENLKQYLLDSGYTDVQELIYKIPLGPWPRDKKLKWIGAQYGKNWVDGLPGFSYKLFGSDGLGWTRDEIEVEMVGVRRGMGDRRVHAYMRYFVVMGRRPTGLEEVRMRREREEDAQGRL